MSFQLPKGPGFTCGTSSMLLCSTTEAFSRVEFCTTDLRRFCGF